MTFQDLMRDYNFQMDHCQAADYLGLSPTELLKLRMNHGDKVLSPLLEIAYAKSRTLEAKNKSAEPPTVTAPGPSKVLMEG